MKRVWILGASGSGKSTLARELAETLDTTLVDLDELHWRPDWQKAPQDEFLEEVKRTLDRPKWVVAGNYGNTQELFASGVDTFIWLDYSFPVVAWRQISRTARRVLFHESCCNGNFETWRLVFSRESSVLWLFRTFTARRRSGWARKKRARHVRISFLHFRNPAQCANWLQNLRQTERPR